MCSGAGDGLADSVLSLRSVEKLSICDINPVPLLRVLSQNAEHCSVSTLGIALEYHPEQVRCVSLGPCNTSHPVPSPHTCTHSVCCIMYTHVFSCTISHGAISQYSFGLICSHVLLYLYWLDVNPKSVHSVYLLRVKDV